MRLSDYDIHIWRDEVSLMNSRRCGTAGEGVCSKSVDRRRPAIIGGAILGIIVLALAALIGVLPAAQAGVLPTSVPPGGCRDGATYQSDVTIPDHTVVLPGVRLEKTWRVRNSGTCTWTSAYRLTYIGGDQLGAAGDQAVSDIVPGISADVTVAAYAPAQSGSYTSVWQMTDSSGVPFGDRFTMTIQVGSGGRPAAGSTPAFVPPALVPTAPTATPVVQHQFTGKIVDWSANCGSTLAKGQIVDKGGGPVNGLRVRVWADGWEGALSKTSGVGGVYGPGEWDIQLRQGQTGKFYAQVWDQQSGSDYTRVDSDMVTMEFNYSQDNCQPESDGHQVAEVRFTRNR
jgi:hypothetical protein